MNPKFAILLDGGFVTKVLKTRCGAFPTPADVVSETKRISEKSELTGYDLFRIYYYDAPPSAARLTNPLDQSPVNLGGSPVYQQRINFLRALELMPNFAVRKGETKANGWKVGNAALKDMLRPQSTHTTLQANDLQPDIQQKGVDLRIGLDIALLALRQFVQVIVVVTADSDFVPAFKFARREGVRVFLDYLGAPVNQELKIHADIVL